MVAAAAAAVHKCFATASHVLAKLSQLRLPMVRRDKKAALTKKAAEAQRAADAGHSKKVFAIARGLAGDSASPLAAIKASDGRILTDKGETQERWREHFTEVFRAKRAASVTEVQTCIQRQASPDERHLRSEPQRKRIRVKEKVFCPSVKDVYRAMLRCNGDKGLGPDQCSARVLQAGGWALAEHIHQLIMWAIAHKYVPVAWRGGKLVLLYKGKGFPQEVGSCRGLLVSNHVAKVLTFLAQQHLNDAYVKQVGGNQFGAVARRGTSLAILALRCFLDMCMCLGLSAMVLFVDLSKAFDYAIREIALGFLEGAPSDSAGQLQHFSDLGLDADVCAALVELISENTSIFEQLHVCSEAMEVARSMHTGVWFTLPGDEEALVSGCGGRQGCKLGALLFNMIYSVALRRVSRELLVAGVVLHLPRRDGAPWRPACSSAPSWSSRAAVNDDLLLVVELTYVDDEALMLAAKSPAALMLAQELLLRHLCAVFRMMGFVINWKAGKSECFLIFRGKRAAEHTEKYRPGRSHVPLPENAGADKLRAVDVYKYLGSQVASDNNIVPDLHTGCSVR